ncbi:hypothetical protein PCASD_12792 [Puccinia coronata f. sp. avenae]|uniref:Tet-like 2OG-Fe(II) oxygenase domain-containing protein n=1 Tax=Puccinia coronata f. sp. avenae TaxID=200324 RepID=A0A2N5SZA3_9BASI|nr:hypothetical protein PCASD_12792 [Puccinia coronata f. sp. avenae]
MAPTPSKQTNVDSESTAALRHLRTRYNLRPPKPSSCPPRSLAVESVAGHHGPSMIGNAHQWHPFQKGSDRLWMTSGVDECDEKGVEEAADPDGDRCSSSLSELSDASESHKTPHKPACKLARKAAHKPTRKPARKLACKPACKAARKPARSKPAKPKTAPCAPTPPTCHQHSHPNPPIPEAVSDADRHGCAICDVYWRIYLNNELQTSQRPENTQEEHASAQPPVSQLTKKQEKQQKYNAKQRDKKRQESNIKYSGETQIRAHVSNSNPNARIQLMRDSFICWADPSHQKLIAVIKFHPFSAMDPALKAQYEFLSQHLIAQTQFQNANKSNGPAYSGEMYSLGWRKAFEANTKVGIQGISDKVKQDQLGFEDLQTHVPKIDCFIGDRFQSVSQPLFDEVKKHHEELKAPGLAPHFERDPDSFTSHLSFTIGAFANTPHMDTNASPFSFVMWIPIEKNTGNLVERNLQTNTHEWVYLSNFLKRLKGPL